MAIVVAAVTTAAAAISATASAAASAVGAAASSERLLRKIGARMCVRALLWGRRHFDTRKGASEQADVSEDERAQSRSRASFSRIKAAGCALRDAIQCNGSYFHCAAAAAAAAVTAAVVAEAMALMSPRVARVATPRRASSGWLAGPMCSWAPVSRGPH